MLDTVQRWTVGVSRVLAALAIAGLLLLAAGTALDVLMRYGFSRPIRGFVDVVGLAGAVLLAACMPYVVASRGHIVIDVVGRSLIPRVGRALDVFADVIGALFFSVLAWQCVRFANDMRETAEAMPVLRWPVWPWWTAVAVLLVLTALVAWGTVLMQRPPEAPDSSDSSDSSEGTIT